jgi:hypothetical protein
MAIGDVQLSLLTFPQRFREGILECRVLLLPTSDPLLPPAGSGLPAFAGADWPLSARVLAGPDALLGADLGSAPGAPPLAFTAAAPATAVPLFNALKTQFKIGAPAPVPATLRRARLGEIRVRKHLPESYTSAFPFERPGPDTSVGNEFGCALRGEVPAQDGDPKPPTDGLRWGEALSFALRQPRLARALGLIHDLAVPVAPDLLAGGGWIYVELDPAGAIHPAPNRVRSYAALLPALPPAAGDPPGRRLFAAALFPVGTTAAGSYDDALAEAALYDDGFARVVHAAQALTADATSSGHNRLRPATDAGIDLGWDDEQVTVWLNRQLDALRARLGGPPALEAPLGVAGYRIDARLPDEPGFAGWRSLCRAVSIDPDGAPAPLSFPPPPAPEVWSEAFSGELAVEPTPVRSVHSASPAAWLPQHFARWQGGSLVAADRTLLELAGATPRDAKGNPLAVPPPAYAAGAAGDPLPPLRYGKRYELRCRLVDLTGGGPEPEEDPLHPGPAPVAWLRFLRHLPPKSVRVTTDVPPRPPGEPNRDPLGHPISRLDVRRPLLGYPELVFAGVDDPAVIAALLAAAPAARAKGDAVGVPDPDVTHLRIEVFVRAPAHDPGPTDRRDGDFVRLYRVETEFPPFDPAAALAPEAPLTLALRYVDVPNIADLASAADGATELPVPRSRDVRLRLTPVCADRPDFFGSPAVREGLTVDLATRQEATAEDGLFVADLAEDQVQGIFLQPGADLIERLGDHLGLATRGLALAARPGERVVFGASAALRHTLAGDRGEIAFASAAELLGRWIAVLDLDLDRDWTWDGLADAGIVVERWDEAGETPRVIGHIQVPFTVGPAATAGDDIPGKDRRARTRLLFLDAVDPNPPAGQLPRQPTPTWRLSPALRGAAPADDIELSLALPVAVPPRQTPKLVSAGLALSPYAFADDYSATAPRRRVLWLELAEPVLDDNDALFARVLSYGPDPLLSGALTHRLAPVPDLQIGAIDLLDEVKRSLPNPPPPPPLALDPEPLRAIRHGQPEDRSGLDAMDLMAEALPVAGEAKPRHFIVPLPKNLAEDAPELFGFWTYELAIGHAKIWSTAQARYGRPLEVRGVQHPAPTLKVSAYRVRPAAGDASPLPPRIVVAAPHATAVFADRRLTDPQEGDPRTRLWALLYAQVARADGSARQNVLLGRAPALPRRDADRRRPLPPRSRDVIGVAEFVEEEVLRVLSDLALPPDAPLSVLVVELLPGDHLALAEQRLTDRIRLFANVDLPERSLGIAGGRLGVPGSDPLGSDLGTLASRRILRCSPLTPVAPAC